MSSSFKDLGISTWILGVLIARNKSLSIIVFVALFLWFISKEIFESATINTTNGKALLVSSYVIQTTLIVDGIFIFLAILEPTLSGLV